MTVICQNCGVESTIYVSQNAEILHCPACGSTKIQCKSDYMAGVETFVEKVKNAAKKKKRTYHTLKEVFEDFYHGDGIRHNDKPDTIFAYGDVVTTNCGWDLGFHSGVADCVYARVSQYSESRPMYGGVLDWYKTGVRVTWEEWDAMCRQYWKTY